MVRDIEMEWNLVVEEDKNEEKGAGYLQGLCQSTKELWANVTSQCPNLMKIGPYNQLSMVITWAMFAATSVCPLGTNGTSNVVH